MNPSARPLPEADWQDVNFDHGAAQALAAALRQAAFWTDQLADARHNTMRWALEEAEGPWADRYRGLVAHEGHDGSEIAEQLRRDAGRIEDASDAARTEQARREGSRLDWLASTSAPVGSTVSADLGLTP